MIFFKTGVRDSGISGKGIFALEPIPRGAIIGDLTFDAKIITEEAYQQAQRDGNLHMIKCAIRVAGSLYVYTTPPRLSEGILDNEDYINHSTNPNMLYHCGLLFALRAIQPDEELTADYQFLLAPQDVCSFPDKETGKLVTGGEGIAALRESTRLLLDLLAPQAAQNR